MAACCERYCFATATAACFQHLQEPLQSTRNVLSLQPRLTGVVYRSPLNTVLLSLCEKESILRVRRAELQQG